MNHSLAPVPGALGVDAHVVRDDGTNWRNLPWGRDGKESLIGHQIWRGNTRAGVTVTLENPDTSYGWAAGTRQDVVAGWPVPATRDAHTGRLTRGASRARVELSKGFPTARFCHLGTDATGLRLALDTFPIFDGERAGMQVYFASARNEQSPARFTYLLNSRNTFTGKSLHAHPILSPDGTMLLFNSAVSGTRQLYLVTQFDEQGTRQRLFGITQTAEARLRRMSHTRSNWPATPASGATEPRTLNPPTCCADAPVGRGVPASPALRGPHALSPPSPPAAGGCS